MTVVVCVTPPPVPVTVIVLVPLVALLPTAIVITDDPVPGAGMGFGLKLTVTRLPSPEADNEIAELKPFKAVVLIVELPELPRVTVTEAGEALMVKSGATPVTVRETVVVCVMPPPTPVTVMVYVPGATLPPTAIVINEVPVPGAGIGLVPNVTVTPLGCPVADNVMALLKPFKAVVLMVDVPLLPCCTVTEDGDALMVKSGVVLPQFANLKFAMRVLQLNEPVVLMYSCVYQNVQSSTGSTCMPL